MSLFGTCLSVGTSVTGEEFPAPTNNSLLRSDGASYGGIGTRHAGDESESSFPKTIVLRPTTSRFVYLMFHCSGVASSTVDQPEVDHVIKHLTGAPSAISSRDLVGRRVPWFLVFLSCQGGISACSHRCRNYRCHLTYRLCNRYQTVALEVTDTMN